MNYRARKKEEHKKLIMIKRGKTNKSDPPEKDIELQQYTPPRVIRLGAINLGEGRCGPGSSDTGMCEGNGISPGGQCNNNGLSAVAMCYSEGSGAQTSCQIGSSPGTNCLTGTFDT